MTNTSKKQIPGVLFGRGIGLALIVLGAGCAVPQPHSGYQLVSSGHPVGNSQSVCVQIGPLTSANLSSTCYQLAETQLHQHIEPLPLDEFGYLFPPLKPEHGAAVISSQTPSITSEPGRPLLFRKFAGPTIASNAHYAIKTVRFSTQMPFQINRAHLSRKNRLTLTTFVNSLEQYHGVLSIRVTGHTDKSGSVRFNQWLSIMRAKSVEYWLLSLGADPRSLKISGVGSSEPRPHAHRPADNRYVDIAVDVRVPAR